MLRRLLTVIAFASLAAVAQAADSFVEVADVAYLADADTDYAKSQCRLDVFYPRDTKDFATVVWFHGGGLREGTRDSGMPLARCLTSEGVAVVLVSYRLHPKVKCPVYIDDAAASVAWTIKHIAQYGGDPQEVFVSGHSAGGYLTAMVGVDPSYLARHKVALNHIAGLLPVSGQMVTHSTVREERGVPRTQPIIDRFAPSFHVAADLPPCLCIVGDRDLPARLEENTYFVAAMKAAGHNDVACQVFEDRDHGTIVAEFENPHDPVIAAVLAFIEKHAQ